MRQLMTHQSEGVQFALDKRFFGLFMEMRLGKTLTYIRWAQLHPDIRTVLVVAPISALNSWHRELEEEGEIVYPSYLEKGGEARLLSAVLPFSHVPEIAEHAPREWVLLNYDAVRSLEEPVWWNWDAVVLDESTKIKNPQAQITKLCIKGFRTCKYRTILSGLPNPESELDFISQFLFSHGSFMHCKNYWQVRSKCFDQDWTGKWILKKGMYNQLHAEVHSNAFVRRRSECNVGSRKLYSRRIVEMPEKPTNVRKMYRDIERDFICGDMTTQWAIVLQTWLARLAGGFSPENASLVFDSKSAEILNLLTGELSGEPVVLWFRFNDELNYMSNLLKSRGFTVGNIYGDVDYSERDKVVRAFQSKQLQYVCCQMKCAKMGMDLSVADTAIYYSTGWSLEDRMQTEDRIIHPTKTTPQLIIDIVTQGTVDEDVVYALSDKSCNANTFLRRMRENATRRATHHGYSIR